MGESIKKLDNDTYAIHSIIEKLEKIAEAQVYETISLADEHLEEFINAIRNSDYALALERASSVDITLMDEGRLRDFSRQVLSAALSLNDNSDVELEAYGLVIACFERLNIITSIMDDDDVVYSRALLAKAIVLSTRSMTDQENLIYEEIMGRYGDSKKEGLMDALAKSVIFRAMNHTDDSDFQRAIELLNSLIEKLNSFEGRAFRELVGRAEFNKALSIDRCGIREQTFEAYTRLSNLYRDSPDEKLRLYSARGAFNLAAEFRTTGEYTKEVEYYEIALQIVENNQDEASRALRKKSLFARAMALEHINKTQALAAYDEFLTWASPSISEDQPIIAAAEAERLRLIQELSTSEQRLLDSDALG